MRIAVTGLHGQVVTSLVEKAAGDDSLTIIPLGRPVLDLADLNQIDQPLRNAAPDLIVSAAAYTAVDKAESESDLARRINGEAPGVIAQTAAALNVPVVHLSTDYVFDGRKETPYVEDDPVSPLGIYGQSKLAGEQAVAAATDRHVILRTAWVYSPFGSNFVKTMLRLARDRDELGIVADQQGAPTSALDIAEAVLSVGRTLLTDAQAGQHGTFHLAGGAYTDWATFAEQIFALSRERGGPWTSVKRVTTKDYPTPAARPANSRLDTAKLANQFGVSLPPFTTSLVPVVERLLTDA